MQNWRISALQAGMLTAGAVAVTGHALAVSQFMRAGGRDAWMSGIVALPLAALAVWSFNELGRRFPGKTVVEYLPKVLGVLGYPIAAAYLLFFFTVTVFTLRTTTDWLVDSILRETPSWVMGGAYIGVVLYAAFGGLDVLARINQVTLPVLTALGILVSLGTMPAKDYQLLRPFLEHGLGPVVWTTVLGLGYYGETSVMGMFHAYVRAKDPKQTRLAYLLAVVFVATTLTGPLAGSIATLGYRVAEIMPYPTFQHWLTLSLARFFERTDLLAMHQWLVGAYVRCGLFLLMACAGFLQLTRRRWQLRWPLLTAGVLTVLAAELAFPTKQVFDFFVEYIYFPVGLVLGIVLPPLLLSVAWVRGLAPRQKQRAAAHGR